MGSLGDRDHTPFSSSILGITSSSSGHFLKQHSVVLASSLQKNAVRHAEFTKMEDALNIQQSKNEEHEIRRQLQHTEMKRDELQRKKENRQKAVKEIEKEDEIKTEQWAAELEECGKQYDELKKDGCDDFHHLSCLGAFMCHSLKLDWKGGVGKVKCAEEKVIYSDLPDDSPDLHPEGTCDFWNCPKNISADK